MGDWILRAEGVNFDNTVFNTNDLSTIRGSSLALEAFVHDLGLWLEKKTGKTCSRVYYGGSQVAFKMDDMTEPEATVLAAETHKYLGKIHNHNAHWPPYWDYTKDEKDPPDPVKDSLYLKPPTEHLNFIVEIAKIEKDPREAVNRAMWQSRRRQMLAPNLPTAPGAIAPSSKIAQRVELICPVDPAQTIDQSINKDNSVIWAAKGQFPKATRTNDPRNKADVFQIYTSKRSADLRTYGRDARRVLYPVQLGKNKVKALVKNGLFKTHDFAQSFHQIVAKPPNGISESVKGKLAYLYFDGNSFSKIRAENDLGKFSEAVEKINAHVLNELLAAFLPGGHDKDKAERMFSKGRVFVRKATSNKDIHEGSIETRELLRLETLLFGGEDFLVVMPAWLAWEYAWKILGWYAHGVTAYATSLKGPRMTHRCGTLICDQKMPVRRARDLAHALCDDAKKAYPENNPQAALSFHIIESIDVPEKTGDAETDIAQLRGHLYSGSNGTDSKHVAKAFRYLKEYEQSITDSLITLESDMARSRLYRLIAELDGHEEGDQDKFFSERLADYTLKGRTKLEPGELEELLKSGKNADVPMRLHLKILADLWDYVDPFDDKKAGGTP